MYSSCKLSNVAKNYLNTFHCILDEMIRGMTEAELSNSISYNFIIQMIPHHQAAIEMSQNILQYTTYIPLQEIACNIIAEQTKGIEKMQEIQCACGIRKNCSQDLCLYQRRMDQIMQNMFSKMSCTPDTNQINADFLQEMIPHHIGAIEMAKTTLQYDICPQLKPILDEIIISQQKEVQQMRCLLRSRACDVC
ncbi:MAG: DUF305 domain-containing protein [Lachnospiraceae bacterium]|nr:DUF305 domain-containing protein [Lachnospiraceae bacterium]